MRINSLSNPRPPVNNLIIQSPEQKIDLEARSAGVCLMLLPFWGVIMETGYSEALVSLVVFAEGTTSIYFGNGGGAIGAGEHQPVRAAGRKLLIQAAEHLSQLLPVASPVLPRVGVSCRGAYLRVGGEG